MSEPVRADALVLFGASGDLAKRKIFPALQEMIRHRHLDVPVIGVARSGWTLEQFRGRVRESLEQHGGGADPAAFDRLAALLRYVDGDYQDPATFERLRRELGPAARPLHYLAIPPAMFETVAQALGRSGCGHDARVVVEKPFGRSLASAQELNRALLAIFPEAAIFRIDHYLGKEPVQNLLYFRFSNSFLEPIWNADHVGSVQITMAEKFGVEGRGKFYEEAGAIRDVIQNHLLQVIACLALDSPGTGHGEALREARIRLLQSIRPLARADVVRGQYRGYRQEPGVSPGSRVETFAAVRLHIDSPRWRGVPFYLRAGKRLPVTCTEVLVELKTAPRSVFGEVLGCPGGANYARFRLGPQVAIAFGVRTKTPGESMVGNGVELLATAIGGDLMNPYARLLGDALRGDSMLFTTERGVEAEWRVVDPILGDVTPLGEYEPGSWGPVESCRLVEQVGGWTRPVEDAAQPPLDAAMQPMPRSCT